MRYIQPTPNPSGAYPAPQSNPFPGAIELTDKQAATLVYYSGFVNITRTEEGVVVTPNTEAWEAKARGRTYTRRATACRCGLFGSYGGGEIMTVFEMAKKYYPRLWDKQRIEALVEAGRLTREEADKIMEEEV